MPKAVSAALSACTADDTAAAVTALRQAVALQTLGTPESTVVLRAVACDGVSCHDGTMPQAFTCVTATTSTATPLHVAVKNVHVNADATSNSGLQRARQLWSQAHSVAAAVAATAGATTTDANHIDAAIDPLAVQVNAALHTKDLACAYAKHSAPSSTITASSETAAAAAAATAAAASAGHRDVHELLWSAFMRGGDSALALCLDTGLWMHLHTVASINAGSNVVFNNTAATSNALNSTSSTLDSDWDLPPVCIIPRVRTAIPGWTDGCANTMATQKTSATSTGPSVDGGSEIAAAVGED